MNNYIDIVYWRTNENNDEYNSKEAINIIKKYIMKRWGIDDLEIVRSENGKPYFKNVNKIKFNISHTEGLSVVAIGSYEIGIDVEKIKPISRKIVDKYYSKGERKELCEYKNNKIVKEIEIWTRKESYCKCIGRGITKESLFWDSSETKEYILKSFYILDCVITVCVKVGDYCYHISMAEKETNEKKDYS